jgi:hypothetical protein
MIKGKDRKILLNLKKYLENTKNDDWCTQVVRTKENKNCIFGHIFNWGAEYFGNGDVGGNKGWGWFEEHVGTTFYVYPINDGEDKDYPQETSKERCLAYIKDVLDGSRLTTYEQMDIDYKNSFGDN